MLDRDASPLDIARCVPDLELIECCWHERVFENDDASVAVPEVY
ncbi:MAG: hypothetical protein ACYSW3_09060 [Planctomycetota bacterium]